MKRYFGVITITLLPFSGMSAQSSPPSGDTVGYWQQRVSYSIIATLDEPNQRVRAHGTLIYVNNSPDTLREMFFHQYLNAFRPGSKWSAADEKEGRERFQHLGETDYGYERFTAPVRVNGASVAVSYPGAPDSTVARIELVTPLAPHDSLEVAFEWDARPSTVPRRQGRRGRSYDLAQWYPKVAVYDRGGWEPNAFRPAGELYGEFGTYDVTLILAKDQVVGATGIPIAGDPGWTKAFRGGVEYRHDGAYSVRNRDLIEAPPGYRAVRFFARDVHHFAWGASPDFRYEGGVYVRRAPVQRWRTWDTVAVHVLYRPGDDTTWAGGRVLRRTMVALQWLEALYGPYAYPQMTVLHRLDRGSTEFPMMLMNGSYSQGLILHEGGHVWTYGVLANNEWKSGWMDEGLTSYQTDWAQAFTPQERARLGIRDSSLPIPGYRSHAHPLVLPRFELLSVNQFTRDFEHATQPIGTSANDFRDFDTYNDIVYDRAQIMYGQLRDHLGDSLFVAFLRDYYARWALKHVDERAMRASAERVSGQDLGWFFDQWVHGTGVMDYALTRVRTRDSSGVWITEATVKRRGEYRHAMIVGARISSGWILGRSTDAKADVQMVRMVTPEKPAEVKLDPYHFTWDWDRRNDQLRRTSAFGIDWPFLNHADRDRQLILFRPAIWYSNPNGAIVGLHQSSNYLGLVDKSVLDVAWSARNGQPKKSDYPRGETFLQIDNPGIPWGSKRPAMGLRITVGWLDDVAFGSVGRSRTSAVGLTSSSTGWALTGAGKTSATNPAVPELWDKSSIDLSYGSRDQKSFPNGSYRFLTANVIGGLSQGGSYAKVEASLGHVSVLTPSATLAGRLYAAESRNPPAQRGLFVSAADPVSTYANHYWRPRGSVFKQDAVSGLPLGGAGLRGYHWSVGAERLIAVNVDLSQRFVNAESDALDLAVSLSMFGDGAMGSMITGSAADWLGDAGVGLRFRGRLYDQPFDFRIDSPFYVSEPSLGINQRASFTNRIGPRWVLSFKNIW
jgi:hypothetical protein